MPSWLDSLSEKYKAWQRERKEKGERKETAKRRASGADAQPLPPGVAAAAASSRQSPSTPASHKGVPHPPQHHPSSSHAPRVLPADEDIDFDALSLDADEADDNLASPAYGQQRAHQRRLSLGEHLKNVSPASSALAAGLPLPPGVANRPGRAATAYDASPSAAAAAAASSPHAHRSPHAVSSDGMQERKEEHPDLAAALRSSHHAQTEDERFAEMLQQQEYLQYMQEAGELSQEDAAAIERAATERRERDQRRQARRQAKEAERAARHAAAAAGASSAAAGRPAASAASASPAGILPAVPPRGADALHQPTSRHSSSSLSGGSPSPSPSPSPEAPDQQLQGVSAAAQAAFANFSARAHAAQLAATMQHAAHATASPGGSSSSSSPYRPSAASSRASPLHPAHAAAAAAASGLAHPRAYSNVDERDRPAHLLQHPHPHPHPLHSHVPLHLSASSLQQQGAGAEQYGSPSRSMSYSHSLHAPSSQLHHHHPHPYPSSPASVAAPSSFPHAPSSSFASPFPSPSSSRATATTTTTTTGGTSAPSSVQRASSLSRAELARLPTFTHVPSPCSSLSAKKDRQAQRQAQQAAESALLAQQVAALHLGGGSGNANDVSGPKPSVGESASAPPPAVLVSETLVCTGALSMKDASPSVPSLLGIPPSSEPQLLVAVAALLHHDVGVLPLTPPLFIASSSMTSATVMELSQTSGNGGCTPSRSLNAALSAAATADEDAADDMATGDALVDDCSICLCDFEHGDELRALPCLHKYHRACIDDWLGRSSVCPNCNGDVRDAFD